MSNIPKAYVYIKNTMVVNPDEKSLLTFYAEEGLNSIEEILEFYNDDWNEILRRWFTNAYYTKDKKDYNLSVGIYNYDGDNDEESVEVMDDDEFEELMDDEIIF